MVGRDELVGRLCRTDSERKTKAVTESMVSSSLLTETTVDGAEAGCEERTAFRRVDSRDLLPLLNRAPDMSPLVVVLALVPVLWCWATPSLSWLDALWHLKAFDTFQWWEGKTSRLEWNSVLWPGSPPLGTWLAAWVYWLPKPARLTFLWLPQWAAAFAFVLAAYWCIRSAVGARTALLAAVLLVPQTATFRLASDASALNWALPLALVTFWGALGVLRGCRRGLLGQLTAVWVGTVGCVLSGGALAGAVVGVLLVFSLLELLPVKAALGNGRSNQKPLPWRERLWRVLVVWLSLAGAGMLGTWCWFEWSRVSGEPLSLDSVFGLSLQATSGSASTQLESSLHLLCLASPLFGLFVAGLLWALLSRVSEYQTRLSSKKQENMLNNMPKAGGSEERRLRPPVLLDVRGADFLVIWLAVACGCWLVCFRTERLPLPWTLLWERFAFVPFVALAAVGLNALLRQALSLTVTLLVVVLTALAVAVEQMGVMWLSLGWFPTGTALTVFFGGAALLVSAPRLKHVCSRTPLRVKTTVLVCASTLVAVQWTSFWWQPTPCLAPPAAGQMGRAVLAALTQHFSTNKPETDSAASLLQRFSFQASSDSTASTTGLLNNVLPPRTATLECSAAAELLKRIRKEPPIAKAVLVGPPEFVMPVLFVLRLGTDYLPVEAFEQLEQATQAACGHQPTAPSAQTPSLLFVVANLPNAKQKLYKQCSRSNVFLASEPFPSSFGWIQLWLVRTAPPAKTSP